MKVKCIWMIPNIVVQKDGIIILMKKNVLKLILIIVWNKIVMLLHRLVMFVNLGIIYLKVNVLKLLIVLLLLNLIIELLFSTTLLMIIVVQRELIMILKKKNVHLYMTHFVMKLQSMENVVNVELDIKSQMRVVLKELLPL